MLNTLHPDGCDGAGMPCGKIPSMRSSSGP